LIVAISANDSEDTAERKRDKRIDFENEDGFAAGDDYDSDY
jgi:hypothetical protein